MASAGNARHVGDPAGGHLVLVGLPGCGKTTVGREVSVLLGRPFVDLDREIERREGRTVARIFEESGEGVFRAAERAATVAIAAESGAIVAAGGGWMTNPGAAATLRPAGHIIYLAVSPERALERMGGAWRLRPMLNDAATPLVALRNLLATRADVYLTADHVIDTEALSLQHVVERVADIGRLLWNAEG